MQRFTFLYPLTCLCMSLVGLTCCFLRLFTQLTLGPSIIFNVLQLLYQWLFEAVLCLSAHQMIKLSTTVTRHSVSVRAGVMRVRRQFLATLVLSPVLWAVMLAVWYREPDHQQAAMAVFLIAGTAVFFIVGGVYVWNVLTIRHEMLQGMSTLVESQQQLRLTAHRKLGITGYGVLAIMLSNLPVLLLMGSWPLLRQYTPYLWFMNHFACWMAAMLQLAITKQVVQTKKGSISRVKALTLRQTGSQREERCTPTPSSS